MLIFVFAELSTLLVLCFRNLDMARGQVFFLSCGASPFLSALLRNLGTPRCHTKGRLPGQEVYCTMYETL